MAVGVTVGIDIGTTSVKAVAADADGRVVASTRVPHELRARRAGELAHDAAAAWCDGPVRALGSLVAGAPLEVAAVQVAAMVPSLAAVDATGRPISDGLLYGDERGGAAVDGDTGASEELAHFLGALVEAHPGAAGYWPAQAVANAALGGSGAIDPLVAFLGGSLFDGVAWDPAAAARVGLDDIGRLPPIVAGAPIGAVAAAGGALLGGGTIDAFGEQLVAGATGPEDVLVILGSTLISWAAMPGWPSIPGLWTIPGSAPDLAMVGGPSNAGGLFLGWVARVLDVDLRAGAGLEATAVLDPARVPVWQPFLRGERVPFHDPSRRASLHDLDIGMGRGALVRAAYEASAFAVRHQLDLTGAAASRIVATGGGARDAAWVQALADGTGRPVDVVAVPEGGALGAAWMARQVAGLEEPGADPGRWARLDHRIEPDARWAPAVEGRYQRYRELAG